MPMIGRPGNKLARLGNFRLGLGQVPASSGAVVVPHLSDGTLPFIGHLYDNKGNFKKLLDPFLNRPVIKHSINGGYHPITLDLQKGIRAYSDLAVAQDPSVYYRLDEASGNVFDLMTGLKALTPTAIDRSTGMSFANAALLSNGDGTTSVLNTGAGTGKLFTGDTAFDIGTTPTAWSIEFWFTTTGSSDRFHAIFQHDCYAGDFTDGLQIYIGQQGGGGSGTTLNYFMRSPLAGHNTFSSSGYTPTQNVVHHGVLTCANGVMVLYVDGAQVYTQTIAAADLPTLGSGMFFGGHKGGVQDVAIYASTLTLARVNAHYVAGTTSGHDYVAAVKADNPTNWWRCGEGLGSLVAEPKIGAMRAVLKSPLYQQSPLINDGKSFHVAGLYGTDGTQTAASLQSYFSSTTVQPITGSKFAIVAWLNPSTILRGRASPGGETYPGGRGIVYVGGLSGLGFFLNYDGAIIRVGSDLATLSTLSSGSVLTQGRHLVAWVHDSSLGTPDTIYVDGVVVATGTVVLNGVPAAGLAIGAAPPNAWNPSSGEVDEVLICDHAISAATVVQLFQAGNDVGAGDLLTLTEQGGDGTVLYKGIIEDLPDDYGFPPAFQLGVQPLVVELADAYFNVNYQVPTDIGQMARDAVNSTAHLTYDTSSIPMTGILAQVNFQDVDALQVMEHVKKIGGPTYAWHVDAVGKVWFQATGTTATLTLKKGQNYISRRYRAPISNLKNKIVCIGNIPPNKTVPIVSVYDDLASQKQYGVRTFKPALVFPNIVDQPTLDLIAASVGSELDRRLVKVEIEAPNLTSLVLIGQQGFYTARYWEPNTSPLGEAGFGSGRYSPVYVVLDVELDGPLQRLVLADIPVASDDLQYEADRIQQRQFLQQLLHPDLSSTIPTSMSGGFFSAAIGTLPTLPNGFTGFSIDAQNGLQLWLNGVLQARYGSAGGNGLLQAYSGYQAVDVNDRLILRFEFPANAVNSIIAAHLSFSLKPFRATLQAVSGAGTAHSHTLSGQTTSTSAHAHSIRIEKDATGLTDDGAVKFGADNGLGHPALFLNPNFSTVVTVASLNDSPAHSHDLTGVTSSNESSHTHNLNNPTAVYETGMSQGAHVYVDGTDRTTALGGPWGSGSALDVSDLDISQWVTTTGWHEIQISSTTLGGIIAQVTSKVYLKAQ